MTSSTETGYVPRLLAFDAMPGLEPELYFPYLQYGLDAIIIGTVPTGGVPSKGKYSFISFIYRATELGIPVYLLRQSRTAAKRGELEIYRRNMQHIYEPERNAIRAGQDGGESEIAAIRGGAMPLEQPDISVMPEVVSAIIEIYSKRPSYEEGMEEVCRRFNSPEFMEAIERIRKE